MATFVAIFFFANFSISMKYLLLLLTVPVVFASCKKKKTPDDPNAAKGEFAFTVKNAPIVISESYKTFYFPFNIKLLSGTILGNDLTCSLDGLPDAVSATPSSMVVGQSLGGIFTISVGPVSLGDYPFRIKVVSAKYGEQFYNATLRITLPPDHAPMLAGSYDSCYDYCPDSGFVHYAATAAVMADTPFILKITNLRNLGNAFVVRATISDAISIPIQTVDGKTVWGSGTYSQDARPGHGGDYVMTIAETIVSGVDTQVCTAHIEH
jgi:hypothetical protein